MEITSLTGPDSALELVDAPQPDSGAAEKLIPAGGGGVLIDVHAAGVSFPEVLQSRGEYQIKPQLPFIPGSEVAGTVRSAPPGSALQVGDRVAALCLLGGFAEVAVAPDGLTFDLPSELSFAEGAALVLNYHTAYFSLVQRGRVREGETVLIHGAAGGIGTAAVQVAIGLGATPIAVVSSEEKAEVARRAGAELVVFSGGDWRAEVKEITAGRGVDIVVDPVGGDRFTESLRSLARGGRLVVVGFASGTIPEVKVNRLLLRNTEVIGVNYGDDPATLPDLATGISIEIDHMVEEGIVRPLIGARFPLEEAAAALRVIDGRGAVGKVILEVGS